MVTCLSPATVTVRFPHAVAHSATMKSFTVLLTLVSLALASPTFWNQDGQVPFADEASGYDLDLSERRLIELEGQAPVWVTEGDKVNTTQVCLHCAG